MDAFLAMKVKKRRACIKAKEKLSSRLVTVTGYVKNVSAYMSFNIYTINYYCRARSMKA